MMKFSIILIIFAFVLIMSSICKKMSKIYNNTKNDNEYDNVIYNDDYNSLIYEVYSKTPNICKEINYIKKYYKNDKLPVFFLIDGIRIYAKSIRMTKLVDSLQNTNGDIGTHYYQIKHYNSLIKSYDKHKIVNIICEIGFQLGVGAITLITSVKHDVAYYGFDYGKSYSRNAYKILSNYFNITMTWGISQITVPMFFHANKIFEKCDIIHIDACHTQNCIYSDILNIKKISKRDSLLLLDDVYYNSYSIVNAVRNNIIRDVKCYKWKPYCIAFFN